MKPHGSLIFPMLIAATLLALIFHPAQAASMGQSAAVASAPAPNRALQFARKNSEAALTSKQGRHYRILVSVPANPPPKDGYPVLYVLDGDAWFGAAVEIVRMREYEKLAPTIVVAIAAPKRAFFDLSRSYDFTPPGSADPDFEGIELGGADEFLNFIDGTLKPWLRARHRLNGDRQILFGHSLGGLFVLHAMFKSPESFAIYLAASPHIRFSDSAILKEASAFETNPKRHALRALVTVGALEAHPNPALVDDYRRYYTEHPEAIPGQTVDAAIADLFHDDNTFDKPAETRALVERLAKSGVNAAYVQFDGEEHMSAAISALNRGIPFALRPPGKPETGMPGSAHNPATH